jgi:hypothetical protein
VPLSVLAVALNRFSDLQHGGREMQVVRSAE